MSHLRIVRDEPPLRRRRRGAGRRQLSDAQVTRLRLAARNLVRAYGSVECLAEVTGLAPATIRELRKRRDKDRPGLLIATRIADAAGMTVEQLLAGRLSEAGTCPTCGADRRAA